jgi:hypothetical protein
MYRRRTRVTNPMRSKNILPVAFACIAAIAVGVAWRNARLVAATNATQAILVSRQAQAESAVMRATARVTAAQQRKTESQVALDALAKTIAAKAKPLAAPVHERAVTQSEVIATDPKVQALALAEGRANAANRYAMFFRTAGLSPAQIDRFLDIVTRRDALDMDLRHTSQAQGLASNDPAVTKLSSQMWNDYNSAQQELLGTSGLQQLRDFERGTPVRMMVSELAGAATTAGVPFTTAQLDQLAQVFVASADGRPGRPIDVQTIDWKRVDSAAQSILSPEQMEFLTTMDPGGVGGRYTTQFRRAADAAKKADAQSPSSNGTSG